MEKVLIASPIRDNSYCMKDYLGAILSLDYPKKDISIFFAENNSKDKTYELLKAFERKYKKKYHSIKVVKKDVKESREYGRHDWSKERLMNLGRMRDLCLAQNRPPNLEHDYVFMVDGDVILQPQTLKHLLSLKKDIVTTLLMSTWDKYEKPMPNFSYRVAKDGYTGFLEEPKEGLQEVKVLMAVWLMSKKVAKALSFIPKKEEEGIMEFKTFSRRARDRGFKQYADTKYPAKHVEVSEKIAGVKKKRSSVLLCVPTLGNCRVDLNKFVAAMLADRRFDVKYAHSFGKPSEDARCKAVTYFLKKGYDYLAFVDSDTVPKINFLDLVVIAERMNVPIISGLSFLHKDFIPIPMAWRREVTPQKIVYKLIDPLPANRLIPIAVTGAGCLIIHRKVLEEFKRRGIPPFHRIYNPNGTVYRGEDFHFFEQANQMGFKAYLHTGYMVHHVKEMDLMAQYIFLQKLKMKYESTYRPREYWNRIWSIEKDRHYPTHNRIIGAIPKESKVLDVGFGAGTLLRKLKANGHKVEGVEISDVAIERLKKEGIKGHCIDVEKEDLPTGYDVVIAAELLEHMLDDKAAIKRIAKASKGMIIVTVPNNEKPLWLEHRRAYTNESLHTLLKPYGKVSIETIDRFLFATVNTRK